MGGVSILLFGIIAASGLRMLVEQGGLYKPVNMILTSVILVVGLSGAELAVGPVVLKGWACYCSRYGDEHLLIDPSKTGVITTN